MQIKEDEKEILYDVEKTFYRLFFQSYFHLLVQDRTISESLAMPCNRGFSQGFPGSYQEGKEGLWKSLYLEEFRSKR